MDSLLKTMQDQIDRQDKTMKAMLMHIDRSRRPEGSLTAKDSPDVDEFKHARL